MNRSAILLALSLLLIAPGSRADFNDGVVAYLVGDYERAYSTMRSLAEAADHGYAQYYLGMMHLNGQGVTQDYAQAGEWFLKAAEHGIAQAQNKLAWLYSEGLGLPRDYERAYAWYRAAAAHGHKLSVAALDEARGHLSGEELAEAEKLADRLIADYGPKENAGEAFTVEPE